MKTVRATRLVMFDVDETLVMWNWREVNPDATDLIDIKSPNSGTSVCVMPHRRHIELMKQFKARGHTVIVWSQGGHEWAEAVCLELGITDIVDYCMDKPNWYVDDLHANAWMKAPIYLDPMNPLKDQRWGIEDEHDLEVKGN